MSLRERHARARAGIEALKSMGIEPKDVQPFLYQRFLRNDFNLNNLPIYEELNLSFQINYDSPKNKKNAPFKLQTAKTLKIKRRISVGDSEIIGNLKEITFDYFGHNGLNDKLQVQGLETDRFFLSWGETKDISAVVNDDVKLEHIFKKKTYKNSLKITDYF